MVKYLSIHMKVKVKLLSCVRLFANPWTVAYQLLHPWDFPGKGTGVGCHFLLQRESEKWKWSHWVVSNSQRPHGLQPTSSSIHGIFQARVLEWGVNDAEIDVFPELLCFMMQWMLAVWSLVPLLFLNPAWTSGSSQFTYCWSLAWRILSTTLLACEVSAFVW